MTPEQFKGFLRGSAAVYLARMGHKDDELQEVKKTIQFLEKLAEVLEKEKSTEDNG
jgi:hypothetical protein